MYDRLIAIQRKFNIPIPASILVKSLDSKNTYGLSLCNVSQTMYVHALSLASSQSNLHIQHTTEL